MACAPSPRTTSLIELTLILLMWRIYRVSHFGRVFLMLKYTDITQNTYVQISTVTEIMAREV
jgi:hypothetical protein